MDVYHITSIESANSILWPNDPTMRGLFEPNTYIENDGDYGINLFRETEIYCLGQPKHTGCRIIFEYEGDSIQYSNVNIHPKTFKMNTLYDQGAWRMFIRGPITEDVLKVKSVEFDESTLNDYIKENYIDSNSMNIIKKFSKHFRKGRNKNFKSIENYKKEFKDLLDKHIKENNIYIKIKKESIF